MATHDDPNQQAEPQHTTREREVIVTDNGGSRNNYGGLIVAVLAIIVFGVLGYLFIGAMGGDGGDGGDGSVMPDDVNVELDTDSGGGGGSGG